MREKIPTIGVGKLTGIKVSVKVPLGSITRNADYDFMNALFITNTNFVSKR